MRFDFSNKNKPMFPQSYKFFLRISIPGHSGHSAEPFKICFPDGTVNYYLAYSSYYGKYAEVKKINNFFTTFLQFHNYESQKFLF